MKIRRHIAAIFGAAAIATITPACSSTSDEGLAIGWLYEAQINNEGYRNYFNVGSRNGVKPISVKEGQVAAQFNQNGLTIDIAGPGEFEVRAILAFKNKDGKFVEGVFSAQPIKDKIAISSNTKHIKIDITELFKHVDVSKLGGDSNFEENFKNGSIVVFFNTYFPRNSSAFTGVAHANLEAFYFEGELQNPFRAVESVTTDDDYIQSTDVEGNRVTQGMLDVSIIGINRPIERTSLNYDKYSYGQSLLIFVSDSRANDYISGNGFVTIKTKFAEIDYLLPVVAEDMDFDIAVPRWADEIEGVSVFVNLEVDRLSGDTSGRGSAPGSVDLIAG